MIFVDLARGTFVLTRTNSVRLIFVDDEQDREELFRENLRLLVTREDLDGDFNGNSDEFSIV